MCSGSVLLLEHLVAESAFGRVDCQHLFEFSEEAVAHVPSGILPLDESCPD